MRAQTLWLFVVLLAFPAAAYAADPYAVEVTSDHLNVRATPNGTWLGSVQRGDRFAVVEERGNWSRFSWRGREAWAYGRHLRHINGSAVAVDTWALNVRTGPSTSYGRRGTVRQDQLYVKLRSDGNWDEIQFDDRKGWVANWLTRGARLASAGRSATPPVDTSVPGSAAGARMTATQAELEILARICKGEAGVASFKNKVAVVSVVLNRVRSRRHPNTIRGVAHQPWQFSAYNSDVRDRLYWGPIPQDCWDAARAALNGWDPSLGATFYFNPYLVMPSWSRGMTFLVRIGTRALDTHDFYKP